MAVIGLLLPSMHLEQKLNALAESSGCCKTISSPPPPPPVTRTWSLSLNLNEIGNGGPISLSTGVEAGVDDLTAAGAPESSW